MAANISLVSHIYEGAIEECHIVYSGLSENIIIKAPSQQLKLIKHKQIKKQCSYPCPIRDVCVIEESCGTDAQTAFVLTERGLWMTDMSREELQSASSEPDIFSDLLGNAENMSSNGSGLHSLPNIPCGCLLLEDVNHYSVAYVDDKVQLLMKTPAGWMLCLYKLHNSRLTPENVVSLSEIRIGSASTYPSLMVIAVQDQNNSVTCNKHVRVSRNVYAYLFDVDCEDAMVPQILVKSDSGDVYTIPATSPLQQPSLAMEFGERIVLLVSVAVKVKLHQGEPRLVVGTEQQERNGLLIVGCNGALQLTLVSGSVPVVFKGSVLGPVTCAKLHNNILVHATKRETYVSDLTHLWLMMLDGNREQLEKGVIKSTAMGMCNVVSLAVVRNQKLEKEGKISEIPVVLLTAKGRLVHMTASIRASTSNLKTTRLSTTAAGAQIKNLLTGINQVSGAIAKVRNIGLAQDEALRQLHLLGAMLSSSGPGCHRDTLSMDGSPVTVNWSLDATSDQTGHLAHCLVVTVKALVRLGQCWNVNVTLSAAGDACLRTLNVSGMQPEEYKRVRVPCEDLLLLNRFPLLFSVSLLYTLPQDLCNSEPEHQVASVCLGERVLDLLYFLKPTPLPESARQDEMKLLLDTLTERRRVVRSTSNRDPQPEDKMKPPQPEQSARVVVPMPHLDTLGVNQGGRTVDPKLLLKWLFRHNKNVAISTPKTQIYSLLDQQVTLLVSKNSSEAEIDTMEVAIISQDSEFLCQVEEAVKAKLKISEAAQGYVWPSSVEKNPGWTLFV